MTDTTQFQTATFAAAKETFSKFAGQNFKTVDEVTEFGKANLDAYLKAGSTFAKGFEEMTRAVAAFGQSNVTSTVDATKALFGAKTIQDVASVQNDYAKKAFDALVSETTKLGELSVRVANEAIEPLNARVSAVIETYAKPAVAA
jgi:phasin family protein